MVYGVINTKWTQAIKMDKNVIHDDKIMQKNNLSIINSYKITTDEHSMNMLI